MMEEAERDALVSRDGSYDNRWCWVTIGSDDGSGNYSDSYDECVVVDYDDDDDDRDDKKLLLFCCWIFWW